MRVAAIQTTATSDRDLNLRAAAALVDRAADGGAELVVLPEYFSVAGGPDHLRANAETLDGPTVSWASDLARRHRIWLLAGSFPEAPPVGTAADPGAESRLRNTSCLVAPDGSVAAAYRKIHLFDVRVAGAAHRESDAIAPGDALCLAPLSARSGGGGPVVLGLSLCYDLRFPELYRALALSGATIVAVPAAFTAATGAAHWEVLLRARAIEDQVFVIAAGQVGGLPPGMPTGHGHSMILDPWGSVLIERTDPSPGVVIADLDFELQQRVRLELPVLANRRPGTYASPR
ncbi:MAG TPA: nitrilase-related carbon-nitrogen hydrolase [Acidimicrobiales bacterium]|jgi:predicted amidohydrolase|nr:nitrilase-related carbon-nitrogen hydrolase [Acidimicrobiales bacterium]